MLKDRKTGTRNGGAAASDQTEADLPDAGAAAVDLAPLESLVGYVLRRAQLAVFEDFIRTLGALALRPGQFSTLLVIERNPGRTQSEVAASLGIQPPNFAAMLDELESRDLARRVKSTTDRRSYSLALTRKGKALLADALRLAREHDNRITAPLGAEGRATLLELLGQLTRSCRGD